MAGKWDISCGVTKKKKKWGKQQPVAWVKREKGLEVRDQPAMG